VGIVVNAFAMQSKNATCPLTRVYSPLTRVYSPLTRVYSPLTRVYSPLQACSKASPFLLGRGGFLCGAFGFCHVLVVLLFILNAIATN
jgi:hypothetical protein